MTYEYDTTTALSNEVLEYFRQQEKEQLLKQEQIDDLDDEKFAYFVAYGDFDYQRTFDL